MAKEEIVVAIVALAANAAQEEGLANAVPDAAAGIIPSLFVKRISTKKEFKALPRQMFSKFVFCWKFIILDI